EVLPALKKKYADYVLLGQQEDGSLKKITKSAISEPILDADKRRDMLFRGIVDTSLSAANHFNSEVVEASRKLKILFDTYGNLAAKPSNEETSAITNLLQELKGVYFGSAKLVGVEEWIPQLEEANKAYDELMKDRYRETSTQDSNVLKQVRQQVDTAYREITELIEAMYLVQPDDVFANDMMVAFNPIIERFNNILAQRKGIAAAAKKKEETE
ncbi:MAG: DUF6261 family protein, partial [Bacteroidales bacterium]|nr:DUF6261 family protein [Bacteroidales bacterium]